MASAKKRPDEAAPGVVETMPGLPGPAEQIADANQLAPVRSAPPPVSAPAPPTTKPPVARRYRVWGQGTLERDGVTYKPGQLLTLPPEVGDRIPCLLPADD